LGLLSHNDRGCQAVNLLRIKDGVAIHKEDAAARAGVTVNQLIKNRLLGRSDNATT